MNSSVEPIRERESLYRLIVSQLRYDGYEAAAQSVSHIISSHPPIAPSSRLSHLVQLGTKTEGEMGTNPDMADLLPHLRGHGVMDLEFEGDEKITAPEVSKHEVTYVTAHKGPSLVAVFSNDGRLAATGSGDCSIKILDVDRMMSKTALGHQQDLHPVIRTLYDHMDAVLALDFHPTHSVIASGSNDCTIKFFDYSKPVVKRAYSAIQEVASIKSLCFHPSGEYILAGTEQPTLRLYDVKTKQCFVSSDARDQHTQSITSVHYSIDGRLYVTGSRDGALKIWDGVSNRCVNTLKGAHDNQPVSSVRFSRNSKYVLSSGWDGKAMLWELSTCRPLNTYQPSKAQYLEYGPCAVFNHTEDYILMGEDKGHQIIQSWDARTALVHTPLHTGHLGTLQYIAHSPSLPAFITCSIDHRVRFFHYRDQTTAM